MDDIDETVVVRFAREGPREGVELSKEREYRVTVDDGPWDIMRLPWDQAELDGIVRVLRNDDSESRPSIEVTAEIGRSLGEALGAVSDLAARLRAMAGDRLVVFWQLDYPELARVPWELACWWTPPHHHILLEPDLSFVRTVPLFHPRAPTTWPTGSAGRMRVLYVWGETPGSSVPHEDHLVEIGEACEEWDVELTAQEVSKASELAVLGQEHFDFVHILAHGVRAGDGEWGLRLADENATGEQIARALMSGGAPPAMVTLSACDSANETDDSFGSVAYRLHAHGVPMVLASQFRLRKSVSTTSAAQVYQAVLSGRHPLEVMSRIRRQLSPSNHEAWSNEVLYSNYSLPDLDAGSSVARQQAALRKARVIGRRKVPESGVDAAIAQLELEVSSLRELADSGFDPAETFGLLGSLTRRKAQLRGDPPDPEELREALDFYDQGFRADANSVYCGVNALHLCVLTGQLDRAAELQPVVSFLTRNRLESGSADYWSWASAGEVSVYAGDAAAAEDAYREFTRRQRDQVPDVGRRGEEIDAAARQLESVVAAGGRDAAVRRAAESAQSALGVLRSARDRLGGGDS